VLGEKDRNRKGKITALKIKLDVFIAFDILKIMNNKQIYAINVWFSKKFSKNPKTFDRRKEEVQLIINCFCFCYF
jgi:hypothetical protein